jgi:hypothetical protein
VVGLIGVLEFHTTPASLTTPSTPSKPAAAAAGRASPGGVASGQRSTAAGSTQAGSASPQGAERTAVGPVVDYTYGLVSVRVTVSNNKIVKVSIASLNDGNNARSQFIDQQSLPLLEQQAMRAQSANIQGVSGASYTSAGFVQSLQGALHSLGLP